MPALDQDTFNVWREGDDRWKERIDTYLETQTQLNLATEKRLTTLEQQQQSADRRATTISSLISTIVGAIVGGFSGSLR